MTLCFFSQTLWTNQYSVYSIPHIMIISLRFINHLFVSTQVAYSMLFQLLSSFLSTKLTFYWDFKFLFDFTLAILEDLWQSLLNHAIYSQHSLYFYLIFLIPFRAIRISSTIYHYTPNSSLFLEQAIISTFVTAWCQALAFQINYPFLIIHSEFSLLFLLFSVCSQSIISLACIEDQRFMIYVSKHSIHSCLSIKYLNLTEVDVSFP